MIPVDTRFSGRGQLRDPAVRSGRCEPSAVVGEQRDITFDASHAVAVYLIRLDSTMTIF